MALPHLEKLYKIKHKLLAHFNDQFGCKKYIPVVEVRKSEPPSKHNFDVCFPTPAVVVNGSVLCRLIDGVDVAFTYMYFMPHEIYTLDRVLRNSGIISYTMTRDELEKNYVVKPKYLLSISVANAKRRKLNRVLKRFCHQHGFIQGAVDFHPSEHSVHYDVIRIRTEKDYFGLEEKLGVLFNPAFSYKRIDDNTYYMCIPGAKSLAELCANMYIHDKCEKDENTAIDVVTRFCTYAYGDKEHAALVQFINKYG